MMSSVRHTVAAMALLAALRVTGGQAAPGLRLQATLAHPLLYAGETTRTYLKIGLEGMAAERAGRRPPVNVALVIDASGSMAGEKITRAREAAAGILGGLNADDTASVVTYNDVVRVVVPAQRLTDPDRISRRLEAIQAEGDTALFAGLSKGAAEIRTFYNEHRVNRIVLISDGLANIGPSTAGALGELGRSLAREGITVTTVGLGTGYEEDLMIKLAQAGDGNHVFARSADALLAILTREIADLVSVVAQDIVIRVTCRPGAHPLGVIGRDADIRGNQVRFRLNQLYGGQPKYAVLALSIDGRHPGVPVPVAQIEVQYRPAGTVETARLARTVEARTTDDRDLVARSVNPDAMIAAVTQVANQANVRALELNDAGQTGQARQMLLQNVQYIQSANRVLQSEQLEALQSLTQQDAAEVDELSSDAAKRKAVRERQYQLQTQQVAPVEKGSR